MGFIEQTYALSAKNLKLIIIRRWFWTFVRALAFPIVVAVVLGYSKHWFSPSAQFGIGPTFQIRTLSDAISASSTARTRFVIVDNGFTSGDIASVIANVSAPFRNAGKEVVITSDSSQLGSLCPANLQGVTYCWGALSLLSSPDHPSPDPIWNYTLVQDSAIEGAPYVQGNANAADIYLFPLQHAVDSAIGATNASSVQLPSTVVTKAFTVQTQAEYEQQVNEVFSNVLISFLLVVFFIAMEGVTYHLAGFMASERELGITELVDAMLPGNGWYGAQLVRFVSLHLSMDIIYLPGWIVVGAVVGHFAFPQTNAGYLVLFHILTGLSLCSASLFVASFFKKAQLSGIVTVIISTVLAVAAQYGLSPYMEGVTTSSVLALGFLFPPMTYIFLLEVICYYQQLQEPLQLNTAPASRFFNWSVPASYFIAFLAIQIVVYPCLASLVEHLLYGVSSKGRRVHHDDNSNFAVRLQNLSLEFKGSRKCCGKRDKGVKAVKDLSLDWVQGSITVLLGVNGSGKSTVLNAISGLKNINSGTVELDGRGGFGLCPQKNVAWPELTVREHVELFSVLKNTTGQKVTAQGISDLISSCDLDLKSNAKWKTLSGGQKRKLQLAMMFAGGSRVCCIDEVSSGIDPLARRKIWDILLAERQTRSILLTTHYLEEADVLSDYIAIMSKGSIKAQGTAVELKSRLGGGYRVVVEGRVPESIDFGTPTFTQFEGRQTIFAAEDSASVASILNTLEKNSFHDYRVHEPTTENVFLRLAEELQPGEKSHMSPSASSSELKDDIVISTSRRPSQPLDLTVGNGTSLVRQTWILFKKRFTILGSNYMPYLAALFIPLCTAGLVTLFFKGNKYPDGLACVNSNDASVGTYVQKFAAYDLVYGNTAFGPANTFQPEVLLDSVQRLYPQNLTRILTVPDMAAFNTEIQINASNLYYGAFYDDPAAPIVAWNAEYAAYGLGDAAQLHNVANQLMLQVPIRFGWSTFAQYGVPDGTSRTVQLALYAALALSVYPALFALYPTLERRRGVRALHYSNGIRSGPLWVAYFTFDFLFVVLVSVLIPVIWTTKWAGWYSLGYFFVVLFLYGLSSILFSYCVSLFVRSQLGAFAATAGIQVLIMVLYFVSFITAQIYAPPDKLYDWLDYMYFTIGLLTPSVSMLRALLVLVNSFFVLCRDAEEISYPGSIEAYGGPILYLILQFFAFAAFLIYWDAGGRISFRRSKGAPADLETEPGVAAGKEGVEDSSRLAKASEGIQIRNITKRFGSLTALEDVSIGIRRSETLALLGPNGAGKSTLISLMRGDIRPSDDKGSIFIEGNSILTQRTAARSHLGVCGQFDAMDAMSVRQQLRFYAEARGVARQDIDKNVAEVMRAFNLQQYAERLSSKLSGGNQRKLSLACALVGGPTVLLLDEPSSGMDPAAQRTLWAQLAHIAEGRVLVLSTHSMEEADALCQRAAILARRVLALGSTDELRDRHGALHIHLVHRDAPHASVQAMEDLKTWIVETVPGALIEDRTYSGQLRFSVPFETPEEDGADETRQRRVASLFDLMEREKDRQGIAYYSIGRTTLDDVFLKVVRRHNVEEENYRAAAPKGRWLPKLLRRA